MNNLKNKINDLLKKLVVSKCSEKVLASKEFDKRKKINSLLIMICLGLILVIIVLSFFKTESNVTQFEKLDELELLDFKASDKELNLKANVSYGDAMSELDFSIMQPKKEPTDEEVVDRLIGLINEDLIKNENESLDKVKSKLYLETKNTYGASITYESVHGYINIKTGEVVRRPKGSGDNKDVLKVIVSYKGIKKIKEIKVTILEDEMTSDEIRVDKAMKELKSLIKENVIFSNGELMKEIEGIPVTFSKVFTVTKNDYLFPIKIVLLLCILILGFYLYESYKRIIDEDLKRTKKLEMEFPNFIEEYMLLSKAGYTFPVAINYIANKKTNGVLRDELKRISDEISRDVILYDSLNSFAIRSGSEMIKKFILGLSSNLKRGSSHMNLFLSKELELLNIERKNEYEKSASENSTKAIMPLLLILIATMLMVVYPATLALKM